MPLRILITLLSLLSVAVLIHWRHGHCPKTVSRIDVDYPFPAPARMPSQYQTLINNVPMTLYVDSSKYAGFIDSLEILGPVRDPIDGLTYYDIAWPQNPAFLDRQLIGDRIVQHWQSTLPEGIQPTYPVRYPQIFVNGRVSNPYHDLAKYGHLIDSGPNRHNLWTVALTDYSTDIKECIVFRWRYVTIFRLKPGRNSDIIHQTDNIDLHVPYRLRNDRRILGRLKFANVYGSDKHPDAYAFTPTAQKAGNAPIEILRVYRYQYNKYGLLCRIDVKPGYECCGDSDRARCTPL